jgi:uncharacterized protein (DUF4415 family)
MKKKKIDPDLEKTKFDFSRARRITGAERRYYRKAYENTFGEKMPRRGRPAKKPHEKYIDIHIKLDPRAINWAKEKAKKNGVGYQTIINEALLAKAAGLTSRYSNKNVG